MASTRRAVAPWAIARRRPDAWVVALGALTAIGLILRLWAVGHQSFWYDESLTVDEVRMRFLRMLDTVQTHEVTPPLYFVSAWTWAKVFGSGEAGLRSLSAIAGALTVPAAGACAATLAGRRAALVAGALVAASPLLLWYSQEARSYALLALLSTLSWLFFLRTARAGRPRDLVLWAAASALALATHYFAIFLVGPELVWLVARGPRGRLAWACASGVTVVGLALLPFAISRRGNGTGWIHGTPLSLRLRQIPEQFAAGFSGSTAIAVATAVVVALAIAGLVAGGDGQTRRAAALALATAAVVLTTPLVLSRVGLDYLITRNVIFALVPLTVLVAVGLAAVRARWLASAGTVALCALGIAATGRIDASNALQRPDWRAVARALGAEVRGRAIVVAGSYRGRPLEDYLPDTRVIDQPSTVREVDVVGMHSPHQPGCWWGAGCNLPTALPATAPPAQGFGLASRRRVGRFTVVRFRAARAASFGPCSPAYRAQARFRERRRRVGVIVFVQGVAPARHVGHVARAARRTAMSRRPRPRQFGAPSGVPPVCTA